MTNHRHRGPDPGMRPRREPVPRTPKPFHFSQFAAAAGYPGRDLEAYPLSPGEQVAAGQGYPIASPAATSAARLSYYSYYLSPSRPIWGMDGL